MATTIKRKVSKESAPVEAAEVKTEVKTEVNSEVVEPKVESKVTKTNVVKEEPKKQPRQYNQNDLILCRSVTAGWLGCSGKSGQYYVFENFGDECEIEYQDLFALKSRHSNYIYAPHFVIEDDELLENPRWADVKKFYYEKVYTIEDVDEVLNLPVDKFEPALKVLPKGLAKTLQVRVASKIEDGSFDSLKKIKIIDETYGTDFRSIVAE